MENTNWFKYRKVEKTHICVQRIKSYFRSIRHTKYIFFTGTVSLSHSIVLMGSASPSTIKLLNAKHQMLVRIALKWYNVVGIPHIYLTFFKYWIWNNLMSVFL